GPSYSGETKVLTASINLSLLKSSFSGGLSWPVIITYLSHSCKNLFISSLKEFLLSSVNGLVYYFFNYSLDSMRSIVNFSKNINSLLKKLTYSLADSFVVECGCRK